MRTWLRQYLPWFPLNMGVAKKGEDCKKIGGEHEWYNIDNNKSDCYHCKVVKNGMSWKD